MLRFGDRVPQGAHLSGTFRIRAREPSQSLSSGVVLRLTQCSDGGHQSGLATSQNGRSRLRDVRPHPFAQLRHAHPQLRHDHPPAPTKAGTLEQPKKAVWPACLMHGVGFLVDRGSEPGVVDDVSARLRLSSSVPRLTIGRRQQGLGSWSRPRFLPLSPCARR